MKQISTSLFVIAFLLLYAGVFWAFSVGITLLLPESADHILILIFENKYLLAITTLIIEIISYLLVSFGLRSYYKLPVHPIELASILAALQIIFLLIAFLAGDSATYVNIGYSIVTPIITWTLVYASLTLADKYFTKRLK
jgi:hypothetical protein